MRSSSGVHSKRSGARAATGERLTVPTSLTELVSARLAALSGGGSRAARARCAAQRADGLDRRGAGSSTRRRCPSVFAWRRLQGSWSWTMSVFVSATRCWRRASRRSSILAGGDRCIAASRELVGDPEQRARHLALGADGPSAEVADELETASASAASRGASGAAAELAELSVSLTAGRRRDLVRRRRQLLAADYHYASGDCGAITCDPRAAARAAAAWCRARGGVAAARRASGRRFREVGAAARAGVRRGRARSSVEGRDRHAASVDGAFFATDRRRR